MWRRVTLGVALGVLSGGLAVLAAPQHGFGWLVLGAAVPMMVAQYHVMPAAFAGVPTALGYGIAAWGTLAVMASDVSSVSTPLLWGSVVAAGLAFGVIGRLQRWLWDTVGYRWWIVAGPLAWGVFCLVRMRLPSAGTDGFVVHSLFRHPAVLQPVSLVGSLGMEIGVSALNVGLAGLVLGALGHPGFPRPRMRRIGIGVAAGLAVWVGLSLALLRDPEPSLRVAAVQPHRGWFAYSPDSEVDPGILRYADLTEQAVDDGARLVVWPEYGLPFDPCSDDDTGGQDVRDIARDNDVLLVAAFGDIAVPADADLSSVRHRNEAVLISPEGECVGRYAKQHPVPWIDERSDTDHSTPVFDTELGRLAMVICYDMDFTDVARAMAAKGAQLIAAPSDDWSEMAEYHPAPLVFRAVENRVAAVKADLSYDSAVIDPYGRIVAEEIDPDGVTAVVVADVPLGSGDRTIWNRSAGWQELAWLTLAALVAALVLRQLFEGKSPYTGDFPSKSQGADGAGDGVGGEAAGGVEVGGAAAD